MEHSLGNSFSPKGHVRVICMCMCIYTSLHKLTKSHTDTLAEAEEGGMLPTNVNTLMVRLKPNTREDGILAGCPLPTTIHTFPSPPQFYEANERSRNRAFFLYTVIF